MTSTRRSALVVYTDRILAPHFTIIMSHARSSMLALSGLVLTCVMAACGDSAPGTAVTPAGPGPQMRPVASVDQVMDGIIIPASQRVFDAVVYVNGKLEQSPKTDDDWFGIQMQA